MGCASSKQSKCRHCQAPYSPVTRRSFSVHHPPAKRGDSYHVVALTSSTLGSIKLDETSHRNHGLRKPVHYSSEEEEEKDEMRNDHDSGIDRKEEFAMGMIEAKAWSKMINEKITRVSPKTPIRTPPGEPETIDVDDLMAGLEDNTSPLRPGEHLRSFSFHVSSDSLPSLVDSPRSRPSEDRSGSPKRTWFDGPEKENVLSNGSLVSKATVSDFDPEVISAFRKALEELSPTNPFHLKPRDSDQQKEQQQQVTQNVNGITEFEAIEKKLNGISDDEVKKGNIINGDSLEGNGVNMVCVDNGSMDKLVMELKKENGILPKNGYADTNGYVEQERSDEKKNDGIVVENGHVCYAKKRVVLYFTSLRGVRKTYEDCCFVRLILKGVGVRVDERDVSMHSGFKEELRELLGDGVKGGLPKVFVGERYIGGVEEIRRMHEEGKLEKVLGGCEMLEDDGGNLISVCDACGDIRFMPCETCSGSCKIYYECEDESEEYEEDDYGFQRCPDCNENGLVRCPICCY